MRIFSIIIFISFSLNSFSQNWLPINPADTYHYAIDTVNYPSNTIWVDSVKQEGDKTVYYLNRIVTDCDTCLWLDKYYRALNSLYLDSVNFPFPIIALKNQPQFLQRKIEIDQKGNIWLNGDQNLFLKINTKLGDQWYFDSSKMIFARYVACRTTQVFGSLDSIKVFRLSGGDSIVLSKNHGFLYFTEFQKKTNYYSLIGIQSRSLGEYLPAIKDIFNFEIGERFQYYSGSYTSPSYISISIINYVVRNKILSQDKYNYVVEGFNIKSRNIQGPPYYTYDTFYYYNTHSVRTDYISTFYSDVKIKKLFNNAYVIDSTGFWGETLVFRTYIRKTDDDLYRFIISGSVKNNSDDAYLVAIRKRQSLR